MKQNSTNSPSPSKSVNSVLMNSDKCIRYEGQDTDEENDAGSDHFEINDDDEGAEELKDS